MVGVKRNFPIWGTRELIKRREGYGEKGTSRTKRVNSWQNGGVFDVQAPSEVMVVVYGKHVVLAPRSLTNGEGIVGG